MPVYLKVILWTLGIVAGGTILFIVGFLGFLMFTEFTPEKICTPEIKGNGHEIDLTRHEFTVMTWNIGYAGMGLEQDFFYDGGKMVIPGYEDCLRNFNGIKDQVKANDTVDFIFLQEIDTYAKRSWYMNQMSGLETLLPGFSSVFAVNYDCRFVPMPIQEPMGRVVAGLGVFSKFRPDGAETHYYDSFFPWPKRLAFLKRCFVMLRFGLENGRELVIINTHNSAFDSSGTLRKRELTMLDSAMKAEYARGNYVITGGDWNSNPRGFNASSVVTGDQVTGIEPPVESDFLPGWQFVFDPSKPSNRYVDTPYKKGVTKTTIIDFFVVSPNIEVTKVTAIPLGFAFSDHEPVVMNVRLK
jgi:endonuclease/exonuclease/phosphatase family metal-dependent hydrolase